MKTNGIIGYYLQERSCPVCGKNFIPAPEHIYRDGTSKVCSWSCQLKAERRHEAEKDQRKSYRGKPIDPKRDEEIRRLANEGMTFNALAAKYKLTPERIRQIVLAGAYAE